MCVEGRDLIDLGLRKLHFVRERREVRRRNVAVAILDQMEEFDQEIAPTRAGSKQPLDRGTRTRVDLAAAAATFGAFPPSCS